MPNQTSHTPQTHQKMKPITIPPEMQDLVKKINELATTVIPELEKSEEENRKRELEKQNEFIEINGIKLETENLGKPTCPEIKLNQQQASETIPQAWEKDGNWYYNFPGAQAEAKFLGKTMPSQKQWEKICEPFWDDGKRLSKELNLPMMGCRNYEDGSFSDENDGGYYWSSSSWDKEHNNSLIFDATIIKEYYGSFPKNGYSVRCIFPEKEETEEERKFIESLGDDDIF